MIERTVWTPVGGETRKQVEQIEEQKPPTCFFFDKLNDDGTRKYPDCENTNPQFCSICHKYLCSKPDPNPCRQDYERRFKAFLHEELFSRMKKVLGRG